MGKKTKKRKEFRLDSAFLKNNWNWIILGVIILFGFYLRSYHIDYPVIGYHNWKETHYLTESRNFAENGFFEHGFFVPEWDYPSIIADPSGAHGDSFPTTSIITSFFFMIFGSNLILARTINILFSLGSILIFYFLIKKLFGREDLALFSSFILTILPLFVFFGRQTQLINPSLFFTLLGVYFYFIWNENKTLKNIFLSSFFLMIGILTKYPTALLAFPLLFMFPYNTLKDKKYFKQYVSATLMFMLIPLWILYTDIIAKSFNQNVNLQVLEALQFKIVFTSSFWTILKNYFADNFTLIGLFFAIIGAGFLVNNYFRNKKNRGVSYFFYYLLGSFLWFIVMAKKLSGHNYHQYPLLPLISFLIAYLFILLSNSLEPLTKIKHSKYFFFAGFTLLLIFPPIFSYGGGVFEAKNRMFDTQFIGLDLAGEYVNQNSVIDERIFFSGHQSYGFLWHADRKGYVTPKKLEDFKKGEQNGVNWVFIYQWGFSILQNKEIFDYIQSNYEIKQYVFTQNGQQQQPLYFLLRKGGSFNLTNLAEELQNLPLLQKEYEYTKGNQILYYVQK